MARNKIKQWIINNKAGLILGFIFGAFIAPFLSLLGLGSSFFESLKLVLVGPMIFFGGLIPNIQIDSMTYHIPIYKWILTIIFNGICYAILGGIIKGLIKTK